MPLYTYTDNATGAQTVRMVSIAERDQQQGLTRIFEPCRPSPPPGGGPRLSEQAQQVLAGYRSLEDKGELRKTRSEARLIRREWETMTEAEANRLSAEPGNN